MDFTTLKEHLEAVATLLQHGGLVVLRTDTIYGIVARAADQTAVERLQRVRQREPGKAFIVLIAAADQAYGEDAVAIRAAYARYQPTRPTSVVVTDSAAPAYLRHRDGSLAYRVPQVPLLQQLLRQTGPLVAPSANPAGLPFARSVAEARAYFGDAVSAYVDDGVTPEDQRPSSVIRVDADGTITQIR